MKNYENLNKTDQEISLLIRAKFPIISIVSYEERRVLTQLEGIRDDIIEKRRKQIELYVQQTDDEEEKKVLKMQLERLPNAHQVLRWSITHGLLHWSNYETRKGENEPIHVPKPLQVPGGDSANPVFIMKYLRDNSQGSLGDVDLSTAIFVFCDLHHWLDREDRMGRFNHMLVRTLRDIVQLFKFSLEPRSIILLSPRAVVPIELNKDIQVIDYPLPTIEQLSKRFEEWAPKIKKRYGEDAINLDEAARKSLMRALSGLTYEEAENVLAKSLANNGRLDKSDVAEALAEKRQIIRKDGILEYFETDKDFKQVGGLELLQEWLDLRRLAFIGQLVTLDGKEIPLPVPKGILMIGVPGGGKSLVAKAVAKSWDLPLLRLDIGRIFGGIVGQSEENMRRAIRIAESVAPAVVWLDEVEKAFPKITGSTDSGVSLRVMNTFLTWMQEKQAPVFVVATGNDISQVPPELTRKGRFDEIFYVGLPNQEARKKIFEIHTQGLPLSTDDYEILAQHSRWYTGAEIEQIVKNALFLVPVFLNPEAPPPKENEPKTPLVRAIINCMQNFVPLARRKSKDGRVLLSVTLEQARMIATPASQSFESLPDEKVTEAAPVVFGSEQRF